MGRDVYFLPLNIIQLVQHSPYFNLAQPVRWHKKWVMSPCREQRKKCEQEHLKARVAQLQYLQLHFHNATKSALYTYSGNLWGSYEIRMALFNARYWLGLQWNLILSMWDLRYLRWRLRRMPFSGMWRHRRLVEVYRHFVERSVLLDQATRCHNPEDCIWSVQTLM